MRDRLCAFLLLTLPCHAQTAAEWGEGFANAAKWLGAGGLGMFLLFFLLGRMMGISDRAKPHKVQDVGPIDRAKNDAFAKRKDEPGPSKFEPPVYDADNDEAGYTAASYDS